MKLYFTFVEIFQFYICSQLRLMTYAWVE